MPLARQLVAFGGLLIGVLGAIGCAHQGPAVQVQPPLAPEVRAQLGTIGVLWGEHDPAFRYDEPAKGAGEGAGRGAVAAMDAWFGPSCCVGDPFSLISGVLIGVTVVPLIGAGVGAIAAPSAEAVEQAVAALQEAHAELWTAEGIRDRVLEAAQARTLHVFVGLPRPAPPAPDEPLPKPHYQALAASGVATVLKLRGLTLSLSKEGTPRGINSDLPLTVCLHSQLVRAADNEILYDYEACYRSSESRRLVAWGDKGAEAFRREMETGLQTVVAKTVDQLFLAEVQPGRNPQSQ